MGAWRVLRPIRMLGPGEGAEPVFEVLLPLPGPPYESI